MVTPNYYQSLGETSLDGLPVSDMAYAPLCERQERNP